MQKKYVFVGVVALAVVVAATGLATNADQPRLKASKDGIPSRIAIPTDLPAIDKLPQQVSNDKALSVLSFDDGTCESGLGAGITVTAFHDFDVPTQCAMGGLRVVGVTARMNTYAAFTGVIGQAGATPPPALAGPFVSIGTTIFPAGPCSPGNSTFVSARAVGPGATITGTANFFFGLLNTGFLARDTNSAPAGRIWMNCAGCGMTQYSPATLSGLGLGGNWLLRVTVEDEDCLPAEMQGACCLPDSCVITGADDCDAQGGAFLGEGTECFSDTGEEADFVSNPGTPITSANPDTVDTIDVADSFIIGDLDVDFIATHSWIGDLDVTIEGPDGTTVLLQDEICGNVDNEDVVFDDEAGGALVCGSPVTGGIPAPGLLDAFDGKDAQGTWTITVTDNVGGDTGTLDQWSLHFDKAISNCEGDGACCTNGPGTITECIETSQDECEADDGLFVGGSCDDVEDCTPLFVEIDSMSATKTDAGVVVSWTTSAEQDNVGFRVLRESGSRAKALVTLGFVNAFGNGIEGASYEFLDNDLTQVGSGTQYWLETIDVYGRTERFGPIEVTGTRTQPNGRTR